VTKIITVINIISLILETNKPQIELSTLSGTALGHLHLYFLGEPASEMKLCSA